MAKADIIPRDVLTGQNTGGMEGAERTNEGESSSYGRQLTGLGKTEQDGMDSIMGRWNGSYPTPLGPEIFFWTDRGWGCLLRKPAMVSQTLLEGSKSIHGLVSLVCKCDMIDYITVVGEALEKMKEEYGVEDN